jgi:hypothetical protein
MGLFTPFANIKNNPTIVTDGLMLWVDAGIKQSYPGSGTTWTDISGNGRNLTLTNGPVFNGGLNGGAIIFDGTNDFLSTTSFANPNNRLTFQILLNYTAKNAYQNIYDRGAAFFGPMMWIDNNNKIEINTGTGLTSDVAYNAQNILITSTSSTATPGIQLYINSDLVKTQSTAQASWTNPYNLTLLNRSGANTLQATIYAIRAYDRVLTAEEVAQNYDFDKQRFNY